MGTHLNLSKAATKFAATVTGHKKAGSQFAMAKAIAEDPAGYNAYRQTVGLDPQQTKLHQEFADTLRSYLGKGDRAAAICRLAKEKPDVYNAFRAAGITL